MITIKNVYSNPNEYRGLSTDVKPSLKTDIGLTNGATFIEMDTSKVFMFDAVSETWKEI